MMNSLRSLLDNLVTAGTSYGWRLDALLLGGFLWMLMAAAAQPQTALVCERLRLLRVRA